MVAISSLDLEEFGSNDDLFVPKRHKQSLKQLKKTRKIEPRKKNGCRGLHHSCHSPHIETEFCKNCDAYVELVGKKQCDCCSKDVVKFLKHTWLSRVLKFGIRQHRNFLNDWTRYPDQGVQYEKLKNPYTVNQKVFDNKGNPIIDPKTNKQKIKKNLITEVYTQKPKRSQMLEIKYRDTVYEIEVKYLALALETNDATDDKAKVRGGEDVKLEIINRHIGIKGLRIWIPDGEIMDTKCTICSAFLRYDKNDNFYCVKCGKSDSFK